MVNCIYENQNHRLSNWNQPLSALQQLQLYAEAIHAKGTPLNSCVGFLDETVYQIARPKNSQPQVCNGYKRVHGLKHKSIVLPNVTIGNFAGSYEGRRHDSFMFAESDYYNNLN